MEVVHGGVFVDGQMQGGVSQFVANVLFQKSEKRNDEQVNFLSSSTSQKNFSQQDIISLRRRLYFVGEQLSFAERTLFGLIRAGIYAGKQHLNENKVLLATGTQADRRCN